jgi:hypothetical protein
MSFISGPYTLTYGASPLGIIEDAASLEITPSEDGIQGDNYGDSIQDGVYRGGNCYLDLVLQEYNAAGALSAFWPFHATFGHMGQVGTLKSSFAAALVLTAVSGTPAASAPATLTANKAVLAPNFPLRLLFGSRLRNVPLRFQFLPYLVTSAPAWFTTT